MIQIAPLARWWPARITRKLLLLFTVVSMVKDTARATGKVTKRLLPKLVPLIAMMSLPR